MIELDGISKWYPTRRGRKYVLRDVSAQLPAGRNLGLIGHNGSGKSTLLRLIGGIDHPNKGTIRSTGKISWPVGLTGGFQRNVSGRENARFVCRINGIGDAEAIRGKLEFIADFAEIGAYFDEPVATYSSGMKARLGFGLSMAFDFDYYLIDEVMSVGDQNFRQKAQDELNARKDRSTFILVSHNFAILRDTCEIGILLRSERIEIFPTIDEAIEAYRQNPKQAPASRTAAVSA